MKGQENMATMSFEGQHESLPSTLRVNIEEENLSYNEEIISRDNEELEKFQIVDNEAQILETLVVKEDESTSLESHEKKNDEVGKTMPEMTIWGEMNEELKNENMTPTFEVDEYIIQLNNEMKGTFVNKKKIEKKIKILEDYVLKLLIEQEQLAGSRLEFHQLHSPMVWRPLFLQKSGCPRFELRFLERLML